MPQLLSRRDDNGWLTPSMADILVPHTGPLTPEDTLRDQITQIQQRLNDLDTPVRIVDVRPSPSHVLYIARAEQRRGRKPATAAEIRRNLGKLSGEQTDWILGFMNQIADDADSVGILLRTPQHQPIHLRQVLLSNTFQLHQSTLAIPIGITLEQQVIIRDIGSIGHLLIVGPRNSRRHLVSEILLSLLMLNTPAELRLALLGESSKIYSDLMRTPHALGRLLDEPDKGQRLLEGMVKEIERRHNWFAESNVDDLQTYNELRQNRGEQPLPNIMVVLAALSDEGWQANIENLAPALYDLLVNGRRVGVFTLLTTETEESVPELLDNVIDTRVVMRSVKPDLAESLPNIHTTALRFIDAFVTSQQTEDDINPIELCTVADGDLQKLISYWQQLATQRTQEARPRERTGLTDLLPDLEGSGLGATGQPRRATGSLPTRTRAGSVARATQVLSGQNDERSLAQATTLAAYLGWLGVGPLRDIFGLPTSEAQAIIETMQAQGIIEDGDGPTYRFLRLADNPLDDAEED